MHRISAPAVGAAIAVAFSVAGCGPKSGANRADAGTDAGASGGGPDGGSDAGVDGGVLPHISGIGVGAAQPVLAPAGASPCGAPPECASNPSINCYGGLTSLADEHSSVLPPGTLPGHASDYLFFVPTKTCLNGDATAATGSTSGLVVLTGGSGPGAGGQWTLDFPQDFGWYDETIGGKAVKGHGQLFLSPMNRTSCPAVAAASQDPTFDLSYANPSSVVVDPTKNGGPDGLLIIYEGTNRCVGSTGAQDDRFYSSLGVATTSDYGHTWPAYRDNLATLPHQNLTAGPGAALGATGAKTCAGNDCSTTPAAGYGRYAVLGPPVTLSRLVATGQPLPTKSMGDSEPSAFVDDVNTSGGTYLYTVQNYGSGGYAYPGTQSAGVITVARARLGDPGPLRFMKWYGPSVSYGATSSGTFAPASTTVTGTSCGPGSTAGTVCQMTNAGLGSDGGGLESPIFPQDASSSAASATTCQANNQIQLGASLSYVEATHQYLLTFLCSSPADPANPGATPPAGSTRGAAWFYSTLDATKYDLSRQDRWAAPVEMAGSWGWLTSNAGPSGCPPKGCAYCVYGGWYPSFMSPGMKPGHLASSGYVFSMQGCQDTGAGGPRAYVSRPFTISF